MQAADAARERREMQQRMQLNGGSGCGAVEAGEAVSRKDLM